MSETSMNTILAAILAIALVAAIIGAGRAALIYVCDVDLLGMEFQLEEFLYEVLTSAALYFTITLVLAVLFGLFAYVF